MSKQNKQSEVHPDEIGAEVHDPLAPSVTDSEGLTIVKKKRTFVNVISGADFKEFEIGEEFTGAFIRPVIREKDGLNAASNPNEKAGTIMGYLFLNDDNGKEEIIGASHQINEAVKEAKPGDVFRFTFQGKKENAKGQPVNIFRVDKAV